MAGLISSVCVLLTLLTLHQQLPKAQAVQIFSQPQLTVTPQSQFVLGNQSAVLRCEASGTPQPVVQWFYSHWRIFPPHNPRRIAKLLERRGIKVNSTTVEISVVTKRRRPNVGHYFCAASNPFGFVVSDPATVDVAFIKNKFRAQPRKTYVEEGKPVFIACKAPKGLPEPHIDWYRNGRRLREDGNVKMMWGGSLGIQHATMKHRGRYVCVARNVAGKKLSKSAKVVVLKRY